MKEILIVERNRDLQDNLKEILELENYIVTITDDGSIAYRYALKYRYDAIISDIKLVTLDGLTLIKKIKSNDKIRDTPFIFLSGLSQKKEIEYGLSLSAYAYITKPFDDSDLLSFLARATATSKMPKIQPKERASHKSNSVYPELLHKSMFKKGLDNYVF